jgi:hypothetical protein
MPPPSRRGGFSSREPTLSRTLMAIRTCFSRPLRQQSLIVRCAHCCRRPVLLHTPNGHLLTTIVEKLGSQYALSALRANQPCQRLGYLQLASCMALSAPVWPDTNNNSRIGRALATTSGTSRPQRARSARQSSKPSSVSYLTSLNLGLVLLCCRYSLWPRWVVQPGPIIQLPKL